MKRLILVIVNFVLLGCSTPGKAGSSGHKNGPAETAVAFHNPLLGSGADPWVYKDENSFYFMCTNGGDIRLWKTPSMSELDHAPSRVVWSPPASGSNTRNIWAPELHYLRGKWYLYYSAGSSPDLSTQRCFVLENSSPDAMQGAWADKGKIGDPDANFFSIDGSVFQYNNKTYFIWSGTDNDKDNIQRIYISEMEKPWALKTHRVQISMPQYDWEKIGGQVNEGPEALVGPTGRLFIIFSVSQCSTDDYGLGQIELRAGGDPLHPADWIKNPSPVFVKSVRNKVFGPGHNGFFRSKDNKESWIIYHANNGPGEGCGGKRTPRMQKFTWKDDGSPDFGEPVSVSSALAVPSGE